MDLSNLKPAKGSVKNKTRKGRGQGSGKGGTSTRGHKGAKARSGAKRKIGFEGGQMPLQRRVPKFGFKNPTRVEYRPVSLSALQALAEAANTTEINVDLMRDYGLASKTDLVKVLGNGEITAAVTVEADAFSKSAISKIEAAGGKTTVIE